MNVFTAVRDWWLRPVTDRLDRIEANTLPAPAPPIAADPRLLDELRRQRSISREVASSGRPSRNTEDR